MTLQISVIRASVNLSCKHDRLDDMVMSLYANIVRITDTLELNLPVSSHEFSYVELCTIIYCSLEQGVRIIDELQMMWDASVTSLQWREKEVWETQITYWGRNQMAAISQTTFSDVTVWLRETSVVVKCIGLQTYRHQPQVFQLSRLFYGSMMWRSYQLHI